MINIGDDYASNFKVYLSFDFIVIYDEVLYIYNKHTIRIVKSGGSCCLPDKLQIYYLDI